MRIIFVTSLLLLSSMGFGNSFTLSNTLPDDLSDASNVFTKYVEVFGLRVLATSTVSDEKVLHTANVLAEYLDNANANENCPAPP